MSRITQFIYPEVQPEPGTGYTPEYHEFFGHLRRARIDKGISLSDMAELVGLPLKSAYDFENLLMPLPFEWLEVWCQIVGVPFADYLAVYWAMEEADFQKLEREAHEREADQKAPGITNTVADATEPSRSPLLAAVGRIANFFSLFSKPNQRHRRLR